MSTTRTTTATLTLAGAALAALAAIGATSAAAAPAAASAAAPAASAGAAATSPQPGAYTAITPTRAVDTRVTGGVVGPGATRRVDLSRVVTARTATAVVLTLTVADPSADGYLTVFPAGSDRPVASSINKRAGEIRSNSVTVALPADGSRQVDVYNQAGLTQVIVDVTGWYDPAAVGTGATYSVPDPGGRPFGGRLAPGESRLVQVENAYISSHSITAVAINFTAVDPAGPGYVTAWNGTGPQPVASNVNYGTDSATPGFAIVPVVQLANGDIQFRVQANVSSADVLVDFIGYYTIHDTSGSLYVPTPPTRVTDTRTSGGALRQNEDRCEPAGPLGLVPDTATAVNLNTTAVDASSPTYLTVYGCGQSKPTTSTLNPQADSDARANAAQPRLGAGADEARSYAVYNQQGTVGFVADLQGWFVSQG